MLDDLRAYYASKGIAAEGFDCPHGRANTRSCRSISQDFVSAREAFVGSEYEKGTLPRVLFVSLDASSDSPGRSPSQRTLEAMRYSEERECYPDGLPKNLHWYRTHEFAYGLLASSAKAKRVEPFLFRDIHKYFAHTNSAKCKDAARATEQGPPLVFDNCRSFIAPEIEVLQPDVLVTQGKWGHLSVDDQFQVDRSVSWSTRPEYNCEILQVGGRHVLRFRLYHPRAFGRFNKQRREAYKWYCAVAQAFFDLGAEGVTATVCEP